MIKKLLTCLFIFFGIVTMASCSDVETYSLKEATGFETFNISRIMSSESVYQNLAWSISEKAYSYLDCKYIKVDFDIHDEFFPSLFSSKSKDDAYVMHVDVGSFGIYEEDDQVFFISHYSKYMYFDGIDGTYRSKNKMSSKFIDLLKMENKSETSYVESIGTFRLNIIDMCNFIYDKPEEQYSYFTPGTVIKLHSLPVYEANLAMYVNDKFFINQFCIDTNEGYIWEYIFTMPIWDVTIEFKLESEEGAFGSVYSKAH